MDLLDEEACPTCGNYLGHYINCPEGICFTKGAKTVKTRYLIEIKYPNKPEKWFSFYESFDSMTEAALRLITIGQSFPHNTFRVIPI
jgi:hypothetical protein